MKDYSKMSDDEIANKVLEALGFKHNQSGYGFDIYLSKHSRKDTGTKASKGFRFDPCNNPSDAWPVISENRISLRPDDMYEEAPHSGYWRADNEAGNHCHHENPLRAAMIVYLMMKDEEK